MRPILIFTAGAALALASGCANVTSSVAGNTAVNGEAWYIRTTALGGLVFASDVFYCPPPKGEGPATCTQAQMIDDGQPVTINIKAKSDDDAKDKDEAKPKDSDEAGESLPEDESDPPRKDDKKDDKKAKGPKNVSKR